MSEEERGKGEMGETGEGGGKREEGKSREGEGDGEDWHGIWHGDEDERHGCRILCQ